jgi:protein-L-isoaspartate(D-aspartate) O-methyltransferase
MAAVRVRRGADDTNRRPERDAMVRQIGTLIAATAGETESQSLDDRVRAAFESVPRHRFVPESLLSSAYADTPLPIGHGQTISQPFIVALMTQLACVSPESNVLEVGTGSGYQAAILGELARCVYSIEIVPELAERADSLLKELGYTNVEVGCRDGFAGWEKHAPFDAILVTAAAPEPPPPLVEQLRPGGHMVLPIGLPRRTQELVLLSKRADGRVEALRELRVAFVPLTRDEGDGDAR